MNIVFCIRINFIGYVVRMDIFQCFILFFERHRIILTNRIKN